MKREITPCGAPQELRLDGQSDGVRGVIVEEGPGHGGAEGGSRDPGGTLTQSGGGGDGQGSPRKY